MRHLTREFYIPARAVKVMAKDSDAVAYLHRDARYRLASTIFVGKQAKPIATYFHMTEEARQSTVAYHFQKRAQQLAERAERRRQRRAAGRGVEVGTILYASWGYEQTNVNFYRVAKLVGNTMAEVEELDSISVGGPDRPWATDKVVPGEEGNGHIHRVVIRAGRATVDGHYCGVWDGRPLHTSSYA